MANQTRGVFQPKINSEAALRRRSEMVDQEPKPKKKKTKKKTKVVEEEPPKLEKKSEVPPQKKSAAEEFRRRNYDEALALYEGQEPSTLILGNCAACELQLGRYAEAAARVDDALRYGPEPKLLRRKAKALLFAGDYEQALVHGDDMVKAAATRMLGRVEHDEREFGVFPGFKEDLHKRPPIRRAEMYRYRGQPAGALDYDPIGHEHARSALTWLDLRSSMRKNVSVYYGGVGADGRHVFATLADLQRRKLGNFYEPPRQSDESETESEKLLFTQFPEETLRLTLNEKHPMAIARLLILLTILMAAGRAETEEQKNFFFFFMFQVHCAAVLPAVGVADRLCRLVASLAKAMLDKAIDRHLSSEEKKKFLPLQNFLRTYHGQFPEKDPYRDPRDDTEPPPTFVDGEYHEKVVKKDGMIEVSPDPLDVLLDEAMHRVLEMSKETLMTDEWAKQEVAKACFDWIANDDFGGQPAMRRIVQRQQNVADVTRAFAAPKGGDEKDDDDVPAPPYQEPMKMVVQADEEWRKDFVQQVEKASLEELKEYFGYDNPLVVDMYSQHPFAEGKEMTAELFKEITKAINEDIRINRCGDFERYTSAVQSETFERCLEIGMNAEAYLWEELIWDSDRVVTCLRERHPSLWADPELGPWLEYVGEGGLDNIKDRVEEHRAVERIWREKTLEAEAAAPPRHPEDEEKIDDFREPKVFPKNVDFLANITFLQQQERTNNFVEQDIHHEGPAAFARDCTTDWFADVINPAMSDPEWFATQNNLDAFDLCRLIYDHASAALQDDDVTVELDLGDMHSFPERYPDRSFDIVYVSDNPDLWGLLNSFAHFPRCLQHEEATRPETTVEEDDDPFDDDDDDEDPFGGDRKKEKTLFGHAVMYNMQLYARPPTVDPESLTYETSGTALLVHSQTGLRSANEVSELMGLDYIDGGIWSESIWWASSFHSRCDVPETTTTTELLPTIKDKHVVDYLHRCFLRLAYPPLRQCRGPLIEHYPASLRALATVANGLVRRYPSKAHVVSAVFAGLVDDAETWTTTQRRPKTSPEKPMAALAKATKIDISAYRTELRCVVASLEFPVVCQTPIKPLVYLRLKPVGDPEHCDWRKFRNELCRMYLINKRGDINQITACLLVGFFGVDLALDDDDFDHYHRPPPAAAEDPVAEAPAAAGPPPLPKKTPEEAEQDRVRKRRLVRLEADVKVAKEATWPRQRGPTGSRIPTHAFARQRHMPCGLDDDVWGDGEDLIDAVGTLPNLTKAAPTGSLHLFTALRYDHVTCSVDLAVPEDFAAKLQKSSTNNCFLCRNDNANLRLMQLKPLIVGTDLRLDVVTSYLPVEPTIVYPEYEDYIDRKLYPQPKSVYGKQTILRKNVPGGIH